MQWLLILPVLLFSIVLHEVAHAWVARREGDDTADRLGRITLNPLPHLDPVGSFLVPIVLAYLPGGFVFGWARPVPVNRANIRTGMWGDIRVSLAGIAVNLALAVCFAALMAPLVWMLGPVGTLVSICYYGVVINLILAVFNLIPIPPLDGSHVLYYLLPRGAASHVQSDWTLHGFPTSGGDDVRSGGVFADHAARESAIGRPLLHLRARRADLGWTYRSSARTVRLSWRLSASTAPWICCSI